MAQREVSDGEIIHAAWQAEDAWRERHRWIHPIRKLPDDRDVALARVRRTAHLVVERLDSGDDIYDFIDCDAAWRAALGWDGKGKPEGFEHYRRRP